MSHSAQAGGCVRFEANVSRLCREKWYDYPLVKYKLNRIFRFRNNSIHRILLEEDLCDVMGDHTSGLP